MTAWQMLGGLSLRVVVGLLALSGMALAKEHWATYAKPRFGTAADYPADLFTVQDPPPENGDGATFRTASGADIYYDRCNFPPHNDDILNCIHVVYPPRAKAVFDPIVTRISASLRSAPHS